MYWNTNIIGAMFSILVTTLAACLKDLDCFIIDSL